MPASPPRASPRAQTKAPTQSKLASRLVGAFWACLALLIGFYGDGEYDLITLTTGTHLCSWPFIFVGLACWAANALLFVYVCLWLQGIKRIPRPLDQSPWAMQMGAASFATAFVSFTLGLWPVFSFLSPVIVVIETFGLIMGLQLVPHFGLLTPRSKEPLTSQFDSGARVRPHQD